MQIYKGKFKSNGNCGYVLKPDIMCEGLLVYFEVFPIGDNHHRHPLKM